MLNELGVKKRQQTDFDLDEANALLIKIAEIAHSLSIMEADAPIRDGVNLQL